MASKDSQLEPKRVVIYVPQEDYNLLQSVLRARGSDVSKWFRQQAYDLLKEEGLRK